MLMRHIFVRIKRASLLNLLLINMGLLDELISGVLFIGLPLLRGQLGLTYEQIGLIFSVAAISGIILEPPLYLLSDRGSKRWWILGGLLGMSCAFALAGSGNSFVLLLAAFALTSPAGDVRAKAARSKTKELPLPASAKAQLIPSNPPSIHQRFDPLSLSR